MHNAIYRQITLKALSHWPVLTELSKGFRVRPAPRSGLKNHYPKAVENGIPARRSNMSEHQKSTVQTHYDGVAKLRSGCQMALRFKTCFAFLRDECCLLDFRLRHWCLMAGCLEVQKPNACLWRQQRYRRALPTPGVGHVYPTRFLSMLALQPT